MSKVTDSYDIENFLNFNDPSKFVPYSFEPLASLNNKDSYSKGNIQQQPSSNSLIGNTGWCKCSNYQQMETDTKSFCCAEADEIHKDIFKDNLTICLFSIPPSLPHLFKICIPINSLFI